MDTFLKQVGGGLPDPIIWWQFTQLFLDSKI